MGNCCFYPAVYDSLYAWDKATRKSIAGTNVHLKKILGRVTSPTATSKALVILDSLPTTVPRPEGAGKDMPLLLDRNCLLIAICLNDTYELVHRELTELLESTSETFAAAKKYLTALSQLEAALLEAKQLVDKVGQAKEGEDLSSDIEAFGNKLDSMQDSLAILFTPAVINDPVNGVDGVKALTNLRLPQPKPLVAYVEGTLSELKKTLIDAGLVQ